MVWTPSFNKSVRVETRNERITGDSGAVSGREVLCRSRIVRWLGGRLSDARDPGRVRHPLASLLRTAMLLVAQGRRDHNDAVVFGDDPAFRLAVSDRAGTTPLGGRGRWRRSPRCRGWSRRCRGRGTWACSARGWPGSRGGGCGR